MTQSKTLQAEKLLMFIVRQAEVVELKSRGNVKFLDLIKFGHFPNSPTVPNEIPLSSCFALILTYGRVSQLTENL